MISYLSSAIAHLDPRWEGDDAMQHLEIDLAQVVWGRGSRLGLIYTNTYIVSCII